MVVRDSPGFVVNRILVPYLNEAGLLLAEGMPAEKIDQAMRRFGMPMGPLELLDQVGLDVAAHIARSMDTHFAGRLPRHPGLEQMVQWGYLGAKAGRGFYIYTGRKKRINTEALNRLRGNAPAPRSTALSHEQQHEAVERMVLLMVNEAAACLQEGLAERADVIDLAMVLGTGWAPHRGGPLRYADDRGVDSIIAALETLQQQHGPRFEPSAALQARAGTRQPFYDLTTLQER